jgi:outer membrane murein-binding lipoprotein Lpp
MANPATQDDGLIILSDDTTNAVIQSPQPAVSAPVWQDTIIDFWLWDSVTSPATPSPVTISVPATPAPTSSVDFSFDLWLDTPTVVASSNPTPSISVQPEVNLSSAPEVKKEEITSLQTPMVEMDSKVLTDDTDMDSILDGTIAKLKARQDVIGQTKGKKTSRIEELSKQIEELQQQVADLKDDVVDLDDENARINTNITSLESMKMFEKAQEEEKIRAHDLKKVAKK